MSHANIFTFSVFSAGRLLLKDLLLWPSPFINSVYIYAVSHRSYEGDLGKGHGWVTCVDNGGLNGAYLSQPDYMTYFCFLGSLKILNASHVYTETDRGL